MASDYKSTLASRDYNLSATIKKWVANTQELLDAVVKQSVQDLIEEAQTPEAKGGKMKVDTGFLRASGQISFTGMPSGPVRGEADQKYSYTVTELTGYQSGQPIFFGWTADYAIYREAYDGFLISAVQNWQKIVDRNTAALRKRLE